MKSNPASAIDVLSSSIDLKSRVQGDAPPIVVFLPEPIGWIALSKVDLRSAQEFARMSLGDHANEASVDIRHAEVRPLLAPDDAARALAVDASWLLKRARENAIPHVRLGKYVRFDPAAIIEFGQRAKDAKP